MDIDYSTYLSMIECCEEPKLYKFNRNNILLTNKKPLIKIKKVFRSNKPLKQLGFMLKRITDRGESRTI